MEPARAVLEVCRGKNLRQLPQLEESHHHHRYHHHLPVPLSSLSFRSNALKSPHEKCFFFILKKFNNNFICDSDITCG